MPDCRFFRPMEVRYADIDPQGHLNNAKYLTYFEQARVLYLTELGLFSKDQSFTEIGVIVADIHIKYEAPITWGTPLKVGVRTSHIGIKSMTVDQCVLSVSDGRSYASGQVILVAYDYVRHATMHVPDDWRRRIAEYEGLGLD